MKARTINMAASSENSNCNGHQDTSPAPVSAAASIAKVEPTCHQLRLTETSANGTVALIKSFPIRSPSLVSARSSPDFGACSNILKSRLEPPMIEIISRSSCPEYAYA